MSEQELLELSDNIIMFYTGTNRESKIILKEQKENIEQGKIVEFLDKNVHLTEKMHREFLMRSTKDFEIIGNYVKQNWELKKKFSSNISNEFIDSIIKRCYECKALGCKVLGAGGGGFILCIVNNEDKKFIQNVISAEFNVRYMPVKIDIFGSRVLINLEEYKW